MIAMPDYRALLDTAIAEARQGLAEGGIPIGAALAHPDRPTVVMAGDGGLAVHLGELFTLAQERPRLTLLVFNDGGYGAEIHKFRANGMDPGLVVHGRGDLAGVATGFGLRGGTVNALGRMEGLFREHQSANGASLWDIHTDDAVVSRPYRRVHFGEG